MPNWYSPLPVKMAEKDEGDALVPVYRTMQTLPLNLSASEHMPTQGLDRGTGAAPPGVDDGKQAAVMVTLPPKQEQAPAGSVDEDDLNRSKGAGSSQPNAGTPAHSQPDRPAPRPKTSSRRRSGEPPVKSRYDAAVGPLTNTPAAKAELTRGPRSCRDDRQVPTSPGPAEPVRTGRSYPVEPAARCGHQMPAVVAVPRPQQPQSGDRSRRVVAERQIRAAASHRTPALTRTPTPAAVHGPLQQQQQHQQQRQQQQQQFAVDPSYNLCMAVECHRATAQDEDGDTPLHIALSQEEVDIRLILQLVELIQLAGKSLDIFNDMQQTPLHIAAITGNPTAARILVEHGANANETDRNGQTAMHNVCANPSAGSSGTLDAIMRYSKVKLDPNKRNYGGFTPMHLSVKNGLHSLTKVLIDHSADINCSDAKSGWTPLFHAVTNHDAEHVQVLLHGNAQVNMQSYSGNTALHVATGRGYTEIVRLLMRYGADMSLRNTHKDTPGMVSADANMSNVLRCVASTSPSPLSSQGSPSYSSQSPHQQLPALNNGSILLITKTVPSPQGALQVPTTSTTTVTSTPQSKSDSDRPRRQTERPPRSGKRERASRRASAATLDAAPGERAAAEQPSPGKTTTTTDQDPHAAIKADGDDVLPANHRVSVIVAPKSLKRRLIERTAYEEEQNKGAAQPPQDADISAKKLKTGDDSQHPPAADDGEVQKVNGVSDSEEVHSVGGSERLTDSSLSQTEPMDLTKRKQEEASTGAVESATNSPESSLSSFSVDEDKTKQGEAAEDQLRGKGRAIQSADANGKDAGVANQSTGGGTAEEATESGLLGSSLPKKERKRKKSERLPPKKRK